MSLNCLSILNIVISQFSNNLFFCVDISQFCKLNVFLIQQYFNFTILAFPNLVFFFVAISQLCNFTI